MLRELCSIQRSGLAKGVNHIESKRIAIAARFAVEWPIANKESTFGAVVIYGDVISINDLDEG